MTRGSQSTNGGAGVAVAVPDRGARQPEPGGAVLEAMLSLVRERTGVDFRGYRAAAVGRRIQNRMLALRVERAEDYLELLRLREGEAERLLEQLTIKVSRFYRHAPAFECLRREVLPELARTHPGRPLRLRSVGCGLGEEAWTLAMLLEEAGLPGTIDATDIDSSALVAAREAVYRGDALAELPAGLAGRYLEPVRVARKLRYRVRELLRERVRFARHDLTGSGPAAAAEAPYDLVCCRNVLIYLEPAAQEQALRALLRMLGSSAYLCLGEAEWPLPAIAGSLRALGRDARVFRSPADSRGCSA